MKPCFLVVVVVLQNNSYINIFKQKNVFLIISKVSGVTYQIFLHHEGAICYLKHKTSQLRFCFTFYIFESLGGGG